MYMHVCTWTWTVYCLQAVELENAFPRKVTKYLELVVTSGYQDTEEAIVLGTEQEDSMWELYCYTHNMHTHTL